MVDHINNGEEGYSVREKLNTVIDRTNTLNGIENQVEANKQDIAKNKTEINNLWEHVDDIEGQIQDLDVSVLDGKIDQEIQDRIDGDQALQDQINNIDPDVDWSDIENKPDSFPPTAHGHEIGDVNGLQDALDAVTPTEIPPWDYEFTPDTLVLRNDKGDIKAKKVIGQQLQMTTGGTSNITPRPNDTIFYSSSSNQLYKNSREGMRDALDVYSKSEVDALAPSSTLEGTWDYSPTTATDGSFTTRNANWFTATTVTLHKFDSTGFEHNFALMSDGDIIYLQTPVGGAEYEIVSKTVSGDVCDFLVNTISHYGPFPVSGESTKVNFIPQVSSGSSVHIGAAPPDPVLEGQQWMEVPASGDATMWIYDGGKWLQQPGGKDGADGADGVDGLWTDNGDTSISYNDGAVGIGTDAPASALHVQGDYVTVKNEAGDVFGYLQGLGGQCFEIGTANASTVKTLSFATDGGSRMTIDADGWVNMANNQVDVGIANGNEPTISFKQAGGATRFQFLMNPSNFGFYIWDPVLAQSRMQLDNGGNLYAYGNIYKNNSTPVIATSDMVKAFSKLRDAVKDEQTVESLKESITNWIGGMIEEWESMQSTATQEISDE